MRFTASRPGSGSGNDGVLWALGANRFKSKELGMGSLLSIVVPVFNEGGNVRPLFDALVPVLESTGMEWELIFSDDGSTDATWSTISALHEADSRVKGLRLSRNFGHQYALFAGMSIATGDAIISMDGDLQHPPELVPELVGRWRSGDQIVHTVRKD